MIPAGDFKNFSYQEKYDFIINILTHVQQKSLFEDLRDLFRAVKKPSEEMLTMVFEIIESVLTYAQKKSDMEKKKGMRLIRDKLQMMKNKEHEERQDLKEELEELLNQLN